MTDPILTAKNDQKLAEMRKRRRSAQRGALKISKMNNGGDPDISNAVATLCFLLSQWENEAIAEASEEERT